MNTPDSLDTAQMVAVLVAIHGMLDGLRTVALADKRPTAITMGLEWLRDDTLKVIADLNPDFALPEEQEL